MAADLGAFAEREDVGIGGPHAVVDDDAAIDGEPGLLGEPGVRPDADRHDHQRRRDDRAVGELDALDLAVAEDRLGVGLGDDLDAALLDRPLQQVAGGRIELALHQRRHEMQHGDVHAARAAGRPPLRGRAGRRR